MNAARRCQFAAKSDPVVNAGFSRRWDAPEPFVSIGQSVDTITRKLAIAAALRLVERAEACAKAGDRRSLVNAAAQILRETNLTPADLPRGRAA